MNYIRRYWHSFLESMCVACLLEPKRYLSILTFAKISKFIYKEKDDKKNNMEFDARPLLFSTARAKANRY